MDDRDPPGRPKPPSERSPMPPSSTDAEIDDKVAADRKSVLSMADDLRSSLRRDQRRREQAEEEAKPSRR
ncbi:MAG TPA: hypothetical protein DCG48_11470 [Rhodospirillaceae bacterium]|nr:hypothetical protein [Rhodospirillaceae bacterium]